jgi:hypothetical protein
MNKTLSVLAAGLMMAAGSAQATVYNFDRSVGAGTVSGFFETDGTLGTLTAGNFIDWSVTIFAANVNGGVATSSTGGSGSLFFSSGVSATATDILFDFANSAIFYTYTLSGDFWCIAGGPGGDNGCFASPAEVIGYNDFGGGAGQIANYSGLQSIASTVAAVPLPAGLPLLAVALSGLGLAARRRKSA